MVSNFGSPIVSRKKSPLAIVEPVTKVESPKVLKKARGRPKKAVQNLEVKNEEVIPAVTLEERSEQCPMESLIEAALIQNSSPTHSPFLATPTRSQPNESPKYVIACPVLMETPKTPKCATPQKIKEATPKPATPVPEKIQTPVRLNTPKVEPNNESFEIEILNPVGSALKPRQSAVRPSPAPKKTETPKGTCVHFYLLSFMFFS